MIEIKTATLEDIPAIQQLSKIVWPITFGDILSTEQIGYMMDMMYCTESLTKQMTSDNHNYVLAIEKNICLGYLSYETNIENIYTKIHKLYVLPDVQGKGVGRILVDYAKQITGSSKDQRLRLNVNRYNKRAIDFYTHLGFSIAYSQDINIGNDFLMEDYVMEMEI